MAKKAAGFITLHRQIMEWEWYKHPNTAFLFIHLLLSANFTDGRFQGIPVKRGQLVTSVPQLSTDTGLSIQTTKTALKHLRLTGEITDIANRQYRVITVVKYDDYQKLTDKSTNDQPTTNLRINQRLTDKCSNDQPQYNNNNNINNENNINKGTIKQQYPAGGGDDFDFDVFWNEYPKKVDKQAAIRAWKKLHPDEGLMEQIISGIRKWKQTDQWNKEDGQYIPYPATWLNKRKWEDDIPERKKAAPSQPEPVRKGSVYDFEQRDYSDVPDQMMADLAREIEKFKRGGGQL